MTELNDFKKYIYQIEDNNIILENHSSDISFNILKMKYASETYNFNKQFKMVNTIKDLINNIENLYNNLIINNVSFLHNLPINNIILKTDSLEKEFYLDIIYANIKNMYDSKDFTEKWIATYANKKSLIQDLDGLKNILHNEELNLNNLGLMLSQTIYIYTKVKKYRELLSNFILNI